MLDMSATQVCIFENSEWGWDVLWPWLIHGLLHSTCLSPGGAYSFSWVCIVKETGKLRRCWAEMSLSSRRSIVWAAGRPGQPPACGLGANRYTKWQREKWSVQPSGLTQLHTQMAKDLFCIQVHPLERWSIPPSSVQSVINLHHSSHPAQKSSLFQTWICVLPATGPSHALSKYADLLLQGQLSSPQFTSVAPFWLSALFLPPPLLGCFGLMAGKCTPGCGRREEEECWGGCLGRKQSPGICTTVDHLVSVQEYYHGYSLLLTVFCITQRVVITFPSQSLTPLSLITSFSLPSLGSPGVLLLQNKVLKT